jgi:hypothetical protein
MDKAINNIQDFIQDETSKLDKGIVATPQDRELRRNRPSKYKSEAALRIEWREWNKRCHPEDQIDWIEFYEEATNKKATW